MLRFAPKVLFAVAVLLLAVQAGTLVTVSGPAWRLPHRAGDLFAILPELLCVTLIGRIALSLMPAGRPGGHGPRELAETLVVSTALGWCGLQVQALIFGVEHLRTPLSLLPWAALGTLRILTLPGALVPGHPIHHEDPGVAARLVQALGLLLIAWLGAASIPSFSTAGMWGLTTRFLSELPGTLVSAYLILLALRSARRAPLARSMALLLFALAIPYGMPFEPYAPLGVAFLIRWLRRADRRACCLSAVAFLALGIDGEPWLALAGLGLLVAAAHPAQGKDAVRVVLLPAAYLVASASSASGPGGAEADVLRSALSEFRLWLVPIAMTGLSLLCLLSHALFTGDEARPATVRGRLTPTREGYALGVFALAAILNLSQGRPTAITAALPTLVVFLGLVWSPDERIEPTGSARSV